MAIAGTVRNEQVLDLIKVGSEVIVIEWAACKCQEFEVSQN